MRWLRAHLWTPTANRVYSASGENIKCSPTVLSLTSNHLEATMYYFVNHINTIIALSWQEKLSLLMNENKRIANPWIKIVKSIGRWKMRWNNTKPNNGRNFQYTKSSVSDLVLIDRRNLSGTRPKLACGKTSNCRFSSLGARNAITKATEYVIFGFSFHIF